MWPPRSRTSGCDSVQGRVSFGPRDSEYDDMSEAERQLAAEVPQKIEEQRQFSRKHAETWRAFASTRELIVALVLDAHAK